MKWLREPKISYVQAQGCLGMFFQDWNGRHSVEQVNCRDWDSWEPMFTGNPVDCHVWSLVDTTAVWYEMRVTGVLMGGCFSPRQLPSAWSPSLEWWQWTHVPVQIYPTPFSWGPSKEIAGCAECELLGTSPFGWPADSRDYNCCN